MLTAIRAVWGFFRSPVGKYALLAMLILYAGWRGYSAVIDRGVAICEARNSKALADSINRAQEQAREMALQDAEVLQTGTLYRDRIRNTYRDREIEIVKHVPADCNACRIGPDGIKLLNDALSNAAATPADPGEQPAPLPGPAIPDHGRDSGGGVRYFNSRGGQVL